MTDKWDARFLDMAKLVASWSKDPSTKVGAVIADGKEIMSTGYNGFRPRVDDHPSRYLDRDLKYKLIVHAEQNALERAGDRLYDCTLYTWPFMPCSKCAAMVIESDIKRVVAPVLPEHLKARWGDDMALAARMFDEAGVKLVEVVQ